MKYENKKQTFFHMNTSVKDGLKKIAEYKHTSLTNLLEEGARMVIHRESMRVKEDMSDLNVINSIVRH